MTIHYKDELMKLWPARTKAQKEIEPVTDLDAIVSEPVPFKFKNKIHYLKPMALDEFLKFTNAQAKLMDTIKNTENKLTGETLALKYHAVISSVCDTITIEDINDMEQAQVAALYQLVIDLVTGQVNYGDGKKKRQKIQIYESVQVSSPPSAQENLAGQSEKH